MVRKTREDTKRMRCSVSGSATSVRAGDRKTKIVMTHARSFISMVLVRCDFLGCEVRRNFEGYR